MDKILRGLNKSCAPSAWITLTLMLFASLSGYAGTLFVGADTEDFAGGFPGPGQDRLVVCETDGPTIIGCTIIQTDFLLNGMADADGKLLTGTPNANPLNTVGFDGTLLNTLVAPGIPNGPCCNEEMLFVPQPSGGAKFYHAHWSDAIREIDLTDGSEIQYFPMSQVVGMALVKGEIWISQWSPRLVGIWDPTTNTFSSKFSVSTIGNAGALAWDPFEEVLWVGTTGGIITPFALDGTQLGNSYQPFGAAFPDTIDGMTFLGEVTPPDDGLEADMDIKFCSNPNAHNCKSGGVLPLILFGSDTFDVSQIDPSTAKLCLADDDAVCVDSVVNWAVEDEGSPEDLGAGGCTHGPDGFDDIGFRFNKKDVTATLLNGCADFGKKEASPTLMFKAMTFDGKTVKSKRADDIGIDQLWRQ
jgi:hypothetical protein